MSRDETNTDIVRAAMIDGAYRQGRGGMVMNLLAVIGIAWLHWLLTGEAFAPGWVGAMVAVTLLRIAVILKVIADPDAYPVTVRERLFDGLLVVTAILWGLLPVIVFPVVNGDERLALSLVLAGMAGGAASVLTGRLWATRIYLICMLAPASAMLVGHPPYGMALGALGACYLAVMLATHAQGRRMFVEANARLAENRHLAEESGRQQERMQQLNEELLRVQTELWRHNDDLERVVAERTEKMRLATVAIENTAEGVMVLDDKGKVLEVNPAFTRITGFAATDIVGKQASMMRSHHQDAEFYDRFWRDLIRDGRWDGELWSRTADGGAFLERRSANAVRDAGGRVTHYVSVFNDITEARQKDERIRHLAFHDSLTGLPNRMLLEDRLKQAVAAAAREHQHLALMFIDLDQFKSVNDGLGHHIGDLLLQQVADRIRARMRSSDTLARLGGDEFVVLLRGVRRGEDCAHLSTEILEALAEPVQVLSHRIHIGGSIGLAVYPEDGADGETLMKNADTAMYAAKAAGRGTFRYFQREMSEHAAMRLELESELRRAIEQNELSLHYQAKVCARDRTIQGYEALLRWRNPQKGMIPPGHFIPVAEDSGLIGRIGAWTIAETCRQIARWHEQGFGWKKVALNVSARQLLAEDVAGQIADATARYAVDPGQIEIELTESVLMAQPDEAAKSLAALKALGVNVAIDDFGTGYSSLAYLRRLPIDVLKIDRSFVTEAELDANGLAIIRTILALGQTLNLTVVAEGVETESQARLLRELGCDLLQGYLFARPLPPEDIEAGWGTPVGGKMSQSASPA